MDKNIIFDAKISMLKEIREQLEKKNKSYLSSGYLQG